MCQINCKPGFFRQTLFPTQVFPMEFGHNTFSPDIPLACHSLVQVVSRAARFSGCCSGSAENSFRKVAWHILSSIVYWNHSQIPWGCGHQTHGLDTIYFVLLKNPATRSEWPVQ
jgi:hypothetical protein